MIDLRKIKDLVIKEEGTQINPNDFSVEQKNTQLRVKNALELIKKEVGLQYTELGKIYRSKAPKSPISSTPQPTNNPTPTTTIPSYTNDTIFYLDKNNTAQQWLNNNQNNPDKKYIEYIAQVPTATWLGNWNSDVYNDVKNVINQLNGKTALFIVYNIPGRDNGSYSSGGAGSPDAYYQFVQKIADAIGNERAWVIVEPDASALTLSLSDETAKTKRFEMLNHAIDILKAKPAIKIGIDASHPEWIQNVDELVPVLQKGGLSKADFVTINISNFVWLDKCKAYAQQIFNKTGKRTVIDTSRNGNGSWQTGEKEPWLNPPDRALGELPHVFLDGAVLAYMWGKRPGESDAPVRGGPDAGVFWPQYAIDLVKNTKM